jgi:hypothetical protein
MQPMTDLFAWHFLKDCKGITNDLSINIARMEACTAANFAFAESGASVARQYFACKPREGPVPVIEKADGNSQNDGSSSGRLPAGR